MTTDIPSKGNITQLLRAWSAGDRAALDELIPLVHEELHRRARKYLDREHPGHILQPTALVNEAIIKLIDGNQVDWKDRAHFFAVSAQIMRHILVDFARSRPRTRDNREARQVSLDDALVVSQGRSQDLIALDYALSALAKFDLRMSQIVELRYFGGLSVEETAEVMKTSSRTIKREWKSAKAWLKHELSKGHEKNGR
jgi:RNA polymerase sigma factor (TIGR02999 family)